MTCMISCEYYIRKLRLGVQGTLVMWFQILWWHPKRTFHQQTQREMTGNLQFVAWLISPHLFLLDFNPIFFPFCQFPLPLTQCGTKLVAISFLYVLVCLTAPLQIQKTPTFYLADRLLDCTKQHRFCFWTNCLFKSWCSTLSIPVWNEPEQSVCSFKAGIKS